MNAETPGFSMILWVLGGVVAGCGALCYAEVGLQIPKSGGEYPIVYDTYGHVPAFLFAWASSTIIRPCGFAICCATFSKYLLSVLRLCDDQIFAERLLSVWVRVLQSLNSNDPCKVPSRQQLLINMNTLRARIKPIDGQYGRWCY